MPTAVWDPRRPVTSIADVMVQEPWRFRLGPLIRWLGRIEGVADPLAGGDFDRAVVRVRHRQDRRPPVHDVDDLRRAPDGRWDLWTGAWNVIGTTGVLAYREQAELGPAGPVRDGTDRLLHLLVASWYDDWRDEGEPSLDFHPWECSPQGLAIALRNQFGVPVQVEPCVIAGTASAVGSGRFLTRQEVARVLIGPVAPDRLVSFLPGGDAAAEISRWLRQRREYISWRLCIVSPIDAFHATSWDAPSSLARVAMLGGGLGALEFDAAC